MLEIATGVKPEGPQVGTHKARAADTAAALKDAARSQFLERGYLNTKITDITAAAGLRQQDHPRDHDLTDRRQLRAHLAVAWQTIRANLPVMVALYESDIAGGLASGQAWMRLVEDTGMLREHLEYLRRRGHDLPGDPTLVAAAMGGMLGMLAYAVLPSGASGYSDDEIIDTLTGLLLTGLRGPVAGSGPANVPFDGQ
jgi:hypothetical protein